MAKETQLFFQREAKQKKKWSLIMWKEDDRTMNRREMKIDPC